MDSTFQTACQSIEEISNAIKNKKDNLPQALIKYAQENLNPLTALCQRGVSNEKNAIQDITNAHDDESYHEALFELNNIKLKSYEACKTSMNHSQRRMFLEDMIQVLKNKENEFKTNTDFLLLMAKIYFFRSLLFRPKGRTVPARKIEALKRSEDLIQQIKNKSTDAWRLSGQIFLSLIAINEPYDEEIFEEVVFNIEEQFDMENDPLTVINDIRVLLTGSEQKNFPDFLEKISLKALNNYTEHLNDVFLLMARTAFQKKQIEDTELYLTKSMDEAPAAFADPYWDDLVDFIDLLKTNNCFIWKKAALKAHAVCCEKETEIGNIYLRWYWSRQNKLYDLAFIATESLEDKVMIADSLKSRPCLRFKQLREMSPYINNFDHILNQEDEARDNRYLKKKPSKPRKKLPKKKFTDCQMLDNQWIVVHFYINEFEKKAYALIFYCETGNSAIESFQYTELFRTFISWQEMELPEYHYENNNEALKAINCKKGKYLYQLCREITRTMPFIFEFPENKSILWVPHGFIHRLPLHAAIKEETNGACSKEIFLFEKHESRYLPAWHLLDLKDRQDGNGHTFLKRYTTTLDLLTKENLKYYHYKKRSNRDYFFESLKKNLQTLIIFCHGKANVTNSFQSRLKFDPPITILDILKAKVTIRGCRIFLGACESDMAQPIEFHVDEHLSLSTALLLIGAKEVIAGLCKLWVPTIEKCYFDLLDSNNLSKSLSIWQRKKFKNWNSMSKEEQYLVIYSSAPIRVMGFI